MKLILFDLGNTLENSASGRLLPGARKTLTAIQEMRGGDGSSPILALVSDFGEIPASPEQVQVSETGNRLRVAGMT